MPSSPGFVSFNDYLNANAGALDTERNQLLGTAQQQGDKALGEYETMATAAYKQGQRPAGGTSQLDLSHMPGYDQFSQDAAKARDTFGALGQGGLGSGKSPWEASLIAGGGGYGQKVQDLNQKYNTAINDYLTGLQGQQAAGAANPIRHHAAKRKYAPDQPANAPGEGPVEKPTRGRLPLRDPEDVP